MFFSTFLLLSTDLPIEASKQFGRAAGDKLLNHLENILTSEVHKVSPSPTFLLNTSLQAVFHCATRPDWDRKEIL